LPLLPHAFHKHDAGGSIHDVGLGLWIGLIGPLSVRRDDEEVPVTAARQRAVLAVLAARAGQVVSFDELAELIWDGAPPSGARCTVRGYVKRLRQVLGPELAGRLVTRAPGYALEVADDELDLLTFDRLCTDGGAAARAGAWQRAAQLLGEALLLWRGQPLADIGAESLRDTLLPRLESQRLQAIESRTQAGLALGQHRELVAGLIELTAAHPLRERFWAQLMLALYRCGRQGEALAAYQRARQVLTAELGVEPGPELRRLQERILAAEPGLIPASPLPDPDPGAAPVAPPSAIVPRQLPAAASHYVGRAGELAALDELARLARARSGSLVIPVINGSAGVGKTALAVHWAHRVAGHFPDGQFYVNLRGFDPAEKPTDPAEAVRGFLGALQFPAEQIPGSPDGQAALYRSLIAGRRMLIVLDNARDSGQVRPLLPGSPGCVVLVTSRNRLSGLVAADGAHPITLDVLSRDEAGELLSRRIGPQRAAREPDAVSELAGVCARLPLALTIAAARTLSRPDRSLSSLICELQDARRRLDELEAGDPATSVRAVFSWSYRKLSGSAARMFRLLGVHPGPDITAAAAASLAGAGPDPARAALAELADAHLLSEAGTGRFALHDLLRAYAAEQARSSDSEESRREAMHRVLDHYLHTAHTAALALAPRRNPISLDPHRAGVIPERPATPDEALAWFETEHRVLLAAVAAAAEARSDSHAWQLPWALADFLDRHGHWNDYVLTQQTALKASQRLGDLSGQAHAHHDLGHAHVALGQYNQAHSHLGQALAQHARLGDRAGEARAHLDISTVLARQARYREAVGHDQQGLRLFRAAGHDHGVARALNSLGWDLAHLGEDVPTAIAYCLEALRRLSELGDRYGEAAVWHTLGYAHDRAGHYGEAADCYQHTLGLLKVSDDPCHVAETLTALGDSRRAAGDLAAARTAWERALAIVGTMHHPDAARLRAKLDELSTAAKPCPVPVESNR
jgi:DNA-binding SARP family transcriptional activator/tetratricopeptide (TPR) repeat protein